jgi:D-psicose/D-tagatose/L-ribulose 3-epimerase
MADSGRWRVSATQWIFGREPLAETAERLARAGYDGIELSGEPDLVDLDETRRILDAHGLTVTSICGLYTPERDISHPSAAARQGGIDYVKRCVELAEAVGAGVVIVVPTAVGRVAPELTAEAELEAAAASLAEIAHGLDGSVRLVIEALNRFETHLVNTLAQADELRARVDSPHVALMADLFHMNIEERDVAGTLRAFGGSIAHVHLADSNRRPPGEGHTDFAEVVATLAAIGYDGSLTMEFLPPTANPYIAASLDVPRDVKEQTVHAAIEHVSALVRGEAGVGHRG